MKYSALVSLIETFAPLCHAAAWDNSGVQVASDRQNISFIAVMLDPSLTSVKKALDAGADFLLAHHPLAMKPRYLNSTDAYWQVTSLLFKKNAWLYSAHTSLDANPNGPVCWLAEALNLQNMSVLEPEAAGADFGFGFIGDLSQTLSYDDFCMKLAALIGRSHWRACGTKKAEIKRVACCPGSGGDLAAIAASSGADVYITGDMKYHPALEAPLRILDVGHFCLEEEMMRRFAKKLESASDCPVLFIPAEDPFEFEEV